MCVYVRICFSFYFCSRILPSIFCFFFFFNDTATTEIYTLSLHDALPILIASRLRRAVAFFVLVCANIRYCARLIEDRKSTRLNSSHGYISYAVFCLKKKKQNAPTHPLVVTARPHNSGTDTSTRRVPHCRT